MKWWKLAIGLIILYYALIPSVYMTSVQVEQNMLTLEWYFYSYKVYDVAQSYLAEAQIQWHCRDYLFPYGPLGYAYCMLINS